MKEALGERTVALQWEKRRIDQEIRDYPTPIAACDAQFNFLLEERARIKQELVELETTQNAQGVR